MPDVLHLIWQPDVTDDFVQPGHFFLWMETVQPAKPRKPGRHPRQRYAKSLLIWLNEILDRSFAPGFCAAQSLYLPSAEGGPLPSPELLSETELPEQSEWAAWKVDCFRLPSAPIQTINELHYRLLVQGGDVRPGQDFLFWYFFTQSLRSLLLKDQYVPAMRCRRSKDGSAYAFHPGWEFLSDAYDRLLVEAAECMPPAAAPGYEAASILRHCAEVMLHQAIGRAQLTQAALKKLQSSFLPEACVAPRRAPWLAATDPTVAEQWTKWRRRVAGSGGTRSFQLALQVHEPAAEAPEHWPLEFLAWSRRDPSLRIPLAEYWPLPDREREPLGREFGPTFETDLLTDLGQMARIYPALWDALDTARPTGMVLSLEEAFAFLTETSWILEDAGFRVIVPAWWTPQGRRRAKLRMRSSPAGKKASAAAKRADLSLDELLEFRYELTLGGETVAPEEWARLVEAKTPLVQFRGQWVVLDKDRMAEMLAFWKKEGEAGENLDVQAMLHRTADEDDVFEIDPTDALAAMLDKLRDHSRLEPIDDPPGLRAQLRDYQKRGVAWLAFLESLKLSGCLADDMGLGKTIQVIARLLHERAQAGRPAPTLLVAPTSVLGNWRKEIERFAPQLQTLVHHGAERCKNPQAFAAAALDQDVVIVSYALALRDSALLSAVRWHRLVLDEAQNIKNPEAKQTKAILKLDAGSRLALTGTPVENRLLDLWSIFNFLNPGYLGRQAAFRKHYETPIQRDHDPARSAQLRRLVEPFILRRVKTDPAIIKDLPDKVENKQYCNLSREQASLYEAVVRDVEKQLEASEGIQRQGLMLSTLMRLKQICNHPAQFLQDDSPFDPQRSHKLERLADMLGDVLAEGESALVFTQFTEIGERLERHLKTHLDCQTYYLHGGTSRQKREQMIARFQDPQTPPAVFVLSLKAGGVGITLTRANHVFHFDRWWNPAVEDQATDRAFRIGQTRNVFVHKFLTLGTLEERIDQMIEDKKRMAGAIVGSDESWLAQLDNDAFKKLIALNRATILDD
ncbi:DEAD/DEAH box helicase [Methylococcus sp. Mc7]|uniref:DEAD/DEAH box helicase n=1 Tax=Methylococcus sp. Mc7 TaxID=2860258 RepID=UPI001C53028B|nr:DEAD/DEAH box helicase [Methylococcus sp. Mc7]QXP82699.1 DEAD/DEAH box helicase [Methylococcus sp. Mc7]